MHLAKFSHKIRSNTCQCRIIHVEFLPYMAIAKSPKQVEIVLKTQESITLKNLGWWGVYPRTPTQDYATPHVCPQH